MEYGYMVNGQLIRVKTPTEQSKPLVYTDEPIVDERHSTAFSWADNGNTIEQVWTTYEIDPVELIDDIPDDEALSILLGGDTE